jgi:Coenzyme PQQ synthesis protein D (PqqD)
MSDLKLTRQALEWREVDGEVVALDVNAAQYLATNGSGALLWRALVDGCSRDDLVTVLVRKFRVDHETAGRDADRFVASLRVRGLLA